MPHRWSTGRNMTTPPHERAVHSRMIVLRRSALRIVASHLRLTSSPAYTESDSAREQAAQEPDDARADAGPWRHVGQTDSEWT